MDPDQTLRRMRELSKRMLNDYYDGEGNGIDQDDANLLVELMNSMDEWLSAKGFLPQDWRR